MANQSSIMNRTRRFAGCGSTVGNHARGNHAPVIADEERRAALREVLEPVDLHPPPTAEEKFHERTEPGAVDRIHPELVHLARSIPQAELAELPRVVVRRDERARRAGDAARVAEEAAAAAAGEALRRGGHLVEPLVQLPHLPRQPRTRVTSFHGPADLRAHRRERALHAPLDRGEPPIERVPPSAAPTPARAAGAGRRRLRRAAFRIAAHGEHDARLGARAFARRAESRQGIVS
jgi:hypothetical protein